MQWPEVDGYPGFAFDESGGNLSDDCPDTRLREPGKDRCNGQRCNLTTPLPEQRAQPGPTRGASWCLPVVTYVPCSWPRPWRRVAVILVTSLGEYYDPRRHHCCDSWEPNRGRGSAISKRASKAWPNAYAHVAQVTLTADGRIVPHPPRWTAPEKIPKRRGDPHNAAVLADTVHATIFRCVWDGHLTGVTAPSSQLW
jgi:hypothetical protein